MSETDRVAELEEEYRQRKIHDVLRAADALNHIFGPALRAYHDEMKRLATVAGRELFTCLPGGGTIVVAPETNAGPSDPTPPSSIPGGGEEMGCLVPYVV